MRPPKARALSVGLAGALAVASLGVVGCSSSDTILALTITAGDGVAQVSKIHVAITTTASGSVTTKDIVPPTKDGGAIQASFFDRITLPESAEGEATVRADALDPSGATLAWGTTTADIQKNHVVAAQVKLFVGGPPPTTDGGLGGNAGNAGNGGSGEAGAGGGAAGAAGGAGGHAGGAGGHAGGGGGHAGGGGEAAGGAGGRRNGNGNGKAGAGGA